MFKSSRFISVRVLSNGSHASSIPHEVSPDYFNLIVVPDDFQHATPVPTISSAGLAGPISQNGFGTSSGHHRRVVSEAP